jgi:hypothetical protein
MNERWGFKAPTLKSAEFSVGIGLSFLLPGSWKKEPQDL